MTPGKWLKFCPQCGRITDDLIDSLCRECFMRTIRLIEPEAMRVSVSMCRICGAYFRGGETRISIEDAVVHKVTREIRRRYRDRLGSCVVEVKRIVKDSVRRRAIVTVSVKAEIRGVTVEQTGEIEVDIKTGTCDRCSRIAGGYYAAIVQIRAQNRFPADDELATAVEIAQSSLSGDDFVSRQRLLKEGLDIYVSSMECGRRISRAIVKRLGGKFTESRRLYGRKDGRNIYRASFAVRLPERGGTK